MKKLSILLALLLMLSAMASCGTQPTTGSSEPTKPVTEQSAAPATPLPEVVVDEQHTLHLSVNAAIDMLDPYGTNNINSLGIMKQFYEGLVYYNYDEDTIDPRVASSYEMSADGLVWTFSINTDVKFHNGANVTAQDVVFSYTRAMQQPVMSVYVASIDKVEAINDATVQITLKTSSAAFLQYVSEVMILNEQFVTENGGNISTAICGTGPYKMDEVDPATSVKASAFEDYWRGEASIKTVEWNVITDPAAQGMALEAGDLDFLTIAHSQYTTMETNKNLNVGLIPTCHTVWITFNCKQAPFDNVLVRQAVAYLIDREAISIACFEGYADVDSLLLNPNINGLPDRETLNAYTYDYDPEKGLELLRQAGYDTTKEIDLGTIYTYAEGHYITKATPVIQANLAANGIKIEINAMETNTFAQGLYAGDFPIGMAGGSYGMDASNYYQVYGSYNINVYGGNPFNWGNDEVDSLFEQGATETDPEARKAIYGRIMEILYNECPGTGVGHKYTAVAWAKDIVIPVLRMDGYQTIYDWGFAAN